MTEPLLIVGVDRLAAARERLLLGQRDRDHLRPPQPDRAPRRARAAAPARRVQDAAGQHGPVPGHGPDRRHRLRHPGRRPRRRPGAPLPRAGCSRGDACARFVPPALVASAARRASRSSTSSWSLGELVPKALALRYTETDRAPGLGAVPAACARASRWVVGFLAASTRVVLRALRHPRRGPAHLRLGGGDQAHRQGGPPAGRPRPDRDGDHPQRLRVHRHARCAR